MLMKATHSVCILIGSKFYHCMLKLRHLYVVLVACVDGQTSVIVFKMNKTLNVLINLNSIEKS